MVSACGVELSPQFTLPVIGVVQKALVKNSRETIVPTARGTSIPPYGDRQELPSGAVHELKV